jgi:integrase
MKETKKGRPPIAYMVSEGDQVLIDGWRDAHVHLALTTLYQYSHVLTRLADLQPHGVPLSKLSYDLVVEYAVRKRGGEKRSESMRQRIWYAAKSFCRWVVASGRGERSSVAGILDHSVWTAPYVRKDPIPPEMVPSVIEAADSERARLVAVLIFFYGLRLGELTRLKLGDLEDDGRRLGINIRAEIAKGKRPRRLSVSLEQSVAPDYTLRTVLDAYVVTFPAGTQDTAFLFPSPVNIGQPMSLSTIGNDFRVACRRAGVRKDLCHPHAGRHTHTIILAAGGVDFASISDILGHGGLGTVWKYLQRPDEDREQAIDRAFRTVFPAFDSLVKK